MKSFFLIFLLIYLSVFPSASQVPIVEIIEEELVAHSEISIPKILLVPERKFTSDYPEQLTLKPQSNPHPELRPPELHPILLG